MFKTLLATATAAAIAIGTLAAGTSVASATSYKYSGGHYVTKVFYVPKKVCEPYYETVSWYDYYGWHTKEVYAGEKCHIIKVKAFEKVWVPYVAKKIYKAPVKLYFKKNYSY